MQQQPTENAHRNQFQNGLLNCELNFNSNIKIKSIIVAPLVVCVCVSKAWLKSITFKQESSQ